MSASVILAFPAASKATVISVQATIGAMSSIMVTTPVQEAEFP